METRSYAELKKDFKVLRRHHRSLVAAMEGINQELDRHRKHSAFCSEQLENADRNVKIQKTITVNQINHSQDIQNNLVKEILELKAEIKKLRS